MFIFGFMKQSTTTTISQTDIYKVTTRFQSDGYILGETFGYDRGTDWPIGIDTDSTGISKESLSRIWYKPSDPTWEGQTIRPWLGAYIRDCIHTDLPGTFVAKLSVVNIAFIKEITLEMAGHENLNGKMIEQKFEVVATHQQLLEIRNSVKEEIRTSGLIVIAEKQELIDKPFDSITSGYINIKFIEGDYFSVKKIN